MPERRERYARKVKRDGRVMLGEQYYYISKALAGQRVVLEVEADTGELIVWQHEVPIKRLPLKGLVNQPLAFEVFVEQLRKAGSHQVEANAGGASR